MKLRLGICASTVGLLAIRLSSLPILSSRSHRGSMSPPSRRFWQIAFSTAGTP